MLFLLLYFTYTGLGDQVIPYMSVAHYLFRGETLVLGNMSTWDSTVIGEQVAIQIVTCKGQTLEPVGFVPETSHLSNPK